MIERMMLLALLLIPGLAIAQNEEDAHAFLKSLKFQQGEIIVGDGLATLNVPDHFRFLGPEDTRKVLVEAWGNPPGNTYLGMLFPTDLGPLDDGGWGVVITYEADGYIKDDDADQMDYDELLITMQEGALAANEQREEMGYGKVFIEGWAEPPHYDKTSKKLYWAKDIRFEGQTDHTLNYAVRVLGRKGVLELNAVANMDQLSTIKPSMEDVVTMAEFNQGHRYADFDPKLDEVAAYGIAGLIVGKVALKVGFFKGLLAILLAGKKFILIGLVALGGLFSKLVGKNKEDEYS